MRSTNLKFYKANIESIKGVIENPNTWMRWRQVAYMLWAVALFVIIGLPSGSDAAVTFYLSPGNDPNGDLAFQAALTDPLYEEDFETYPRWYYFQMKLGGPGSSGNLLVDEMYVQDTMGNRYTDYGIEVFDLTKWPEGEMIGRKVLLNRTYSGTDVFGPVLEFNCAAPMEGFGTWIMDDKVLDTQYVIKVTEVGGATYTSPVLDSGISGVPTIEGFIGVVSSVGIEQVLVEQQLLDGTPTADDAFYLDHMQIAGLIIEDVCDDSADNDGDGLTDCEDPDCSNDPACPEVCDDDIDNDADGLIDCDDPECSDDPACPEICDDGIDNDVDRLTDCEDPECSTFPGCADAPSFYYSPGSDPDGDLPFQAALNCFPTEFDLDDLPEPSYVDTIVVAGAQTINMYVLDTMGNRYTDHGVEVFYLLNFHQPGMMDDNTLLNRTYSGGDVFGAAIEFNFALPVEGFGVWILDDKVEVSQFVMKVTLTGGETFTSSPFDSGNGIQVAIEGFIGAVSSIGIEKVVIEMQLLDGTASAGDAFDLDYLQVGCLIAPEDCADGMDNNGDGLIDCDDPQCWNNPGYPNCPETFCSDGLDNEQDGFIDCVDPDCFGQPGCTIESLCDDGLDNDADCLVDGSDPDCVAGEVIVFIEEANAALDGSIYGAGGGTVEPFYRAAYAGRHDGDVAWCVSKFDLSNFLPPGTTSADIAWAGLSVPRTDVKLYSNHGLPWLLDLVLHHFETTDNTTIVSADHHLSTPALTDYGIVIPQHVQQNLNPVARVFVDVTEAIKDDLDNGRALSSFRIGADPSGSLAGTDLTYFATIENADPFFGAGPQESRNVLRLFVHLLGQGEDNCSDSSDNDGDGIMDCQDADCYSNAATCSLFEFCGDGWDNDFDDLVDCEDPDCRNNPCCGCGNDPFADADGDGDVDQDDFAVFQVCYTGPGSEVQIPEAPEYCQCFNRDDDEDIDRYDYEAFEACASGPMIHAEITCDDVP